MKKCLNCGKKLSSNPKSIRCHSCQSKYLYKKGILNVSGKNNPNYKDGKPKCTVCGKIFLNTEDYTKRRCWNCYVKSMQIPSNNPNWLGGIGKDGYSFKFTKELKEKIHSRDKHKCLICNMNEKEHLKKYKKLLDVHHIDYNKKNCKENNLITLCHRCNIRANYNRKYWLKFIKNLIKE